MSTYPSVGILIATRLTASEAVKYECPDSTEMKITMGTVCNVSGSAATVTIGVVRAGATMGSGTHEVMHALSVDAGDTQSLRDYLADHMMGPGDRITAFSGTNNVLDLVVSGVVFA